MISFNWNKAFNHSRLLLVSIYCCLSFPVWNPYSTSIEPAVLRLSKRWKPIEVWTRLGSAALTAALTKTYSDSLWRRGPLLVPVWNIRPVKCSTNWGANQANKQQTKLQRSLGIFVFSSFLFHFFLFLQMTHQHKHSRNSQLCVWRYS